MEREKKAKIPPICKYGWGGGAGQGEIWVGKKHMNLETEKWF